MDERPINAGVDAPTEPIPVVRVVPPRPAVSAPYASYAPIPVPATVVAPPYDHRFGSVPFYLFARLAACAIDLGLVAFVLATFGFHAFDAGFFMLAARNETGFDTLAALSVGGALVFALCCEALFGTTLGKLAFALQVRCTNGRFPGVLRIFARSVLRPIDLLLIGPLLALVTPRHQRLGDLVAGTVVGRSRLGALASLIGLALLAGIGYAQVMFGGGLTSAVGVSAEAADFTPSLYGRAARALGMRTFVAPQPVAQPSDAAPPQPQASDATTVQ